MTEAVQKWVGMLLPAALAAASTWGVIQHQLGSLDKSLGEINASLAVLREASSRSDERVATLRRDLDRIEDRGEINEIDLESIKLALARAGMHVDN